MPTIPGPVDPILGVIGSIGSGGAPNKTTINAAAKGAGAVQNVTDITSFFTNSQLWVRIGETAAGLILLFVGLKTLFPAQVSVITGAAKNATKAAGMAAML